VTEAVSPPEPAARQDSPTRRALWWLLRVVSTALALGYLVHNTDFEQTLRALERIPLLTGCLAAGMFLTTVVLGTWRWQSIMRAFGATQVPLFDDLLRLQLIGVFYNTCLPGGIGGDVVRGLATRDTFAARPLAGMAVVFGDRLMALLALVALTCTALTVAPPAGLVWARTVGIAGVCACAALAVCLALKARLLDALPQKMAAAVRELPGSARHLTPAVMLALASQVLVALAGHALMASIAPGVALADSLVFIPLAAATSFVPVTISGLGVREAAVVALYGSVGVSSDTALAGAIALYLCQVFIALIGGLILLLGVRLRRDAGHGGR
jgi:glycosyltransferase 2 family protein